jgi:hypothetical protein
MHASLSIDIWYTVLDLPATAEDGEESTTPHCVCLVRLFIIAHLADMQTLLLHGILAFGWVVALSIMRY